MFLSVPYAWRSGIYKGLGTPLPFSADCFVARHRGTRRRQHAQRQQQQGKGPSPRPGAEELAVALDGRSQLAARFEQGADGQPLVRVFDRERGETVALLTPEELRTLAEQTGLPPGMLVRVSS